jgi:hypothetical protein
VIRPESNRPIKTFLAVGAFAFVIALATTSGHAFLFAQAKPVTPLTSLPMTSVGNLAPNGGHGLLIHNAETERF